MTKMYISFIRYVQKLILGIHFHRGIIFSRIRAISIAKKNYFQKRDNFRKANRKLKRKKKCFSYKMAIIVPSVSKPTEVSTLVSIFQRNFTIWAYVIHNPTIPHSQTITVLFIWTALCQNVSSGIVDMQTAKAQICLRIHAFWSWLISELLDTT